MCLLFLYIIILYFIKQETILNNKHEKAVFLFCTLLSCSLAIPYRMYLIYQGYEYGLANLDMQYYMSLAERIKDISIQEGFDAISSHWNFAQINAIQIWGYRFYIYFLTLTIFKWTFIPVGISVFLVSIWQLLLAAYSVLRIYNSIKPKFIKYNSSSLFLMLIAPPIWYGCVRLLREVFMLFCIEIMISALCRKERYWGLKIVVSMVTLTLLRPYYAVFMFPLLFMLNGKEKLSLIVEGGIFVILAAMCAVVRIGPLTIVSVVLSPNFFNQVRAVWQGALEVSVASGQIPIVIFIGSIWNFIMIVYAVISLVLTKNFNMRCWCSLGLILDICMTYAISFGGASELRHKMFFVIPFIILLNNGEFRLSINKKINGGKISRNTVAINLCFGMFLAICILISGLIS